MRCSPAVTHRNINKYVEACPEGCDNCRHVMQMARETVTECSESCRKNFQITCDGDHISLCFWSGSKANRFVVQFSNGNIYVTTENLSWWESLKRFFLQKRKKVAGAILVGAGMLMTTFGAPVPFLPVVGQVIVQCGHALMRLGDGNDDTTRVYKVT